MRNIDSLLLVQVPTRDQTRNPGVCPDQELNSDLSLCRTTPNQLSHSSQGIAFQFLNAKCGSAFLSRRNPRQTNWTALYRRKHKMGQLEEIQKKSTCCAVEFQRAITGACLADIMAKKNQEPEVRKAQREQATRAVKEAKKAKQASKKTERRQWLLLRLPHKGSTWAERRL